MPVGLLARLAFIQYNFIAMNKLEFTENQTPLAVDILHAWHRTAKIELEFYEHEFRGRPNTKVLIDARETFDKVRRDFQDNMRYLSQGHRVIYLDSIEIQEALKDVIRTHLRKGYAFPSNPLIWVKSFKRAIEAFQVLKQLRPDYECRSIKYFLRYN